MHYRLFLKKKTIDKNQTVTSIIKFKKSHKRVKLFFRSYNLKYITN